MTIKPSRIELEHATGPINVGEGLKYGVIAGTKATVTSYSDATAQLREWRKVNPAGRPETVDYSVIFEDGFRLNGSLQIIGAGGLNAEGPDFVDALSSGLRRLVSDKPSDVPFQRFVDKDGKKREAAIKLLETYDLGLEVNTSQPTMSR